MAKKKDKKKLKKKDKALKSTAAEGKARGKDLKQKINQLQRELAQRDNQIEALNLQLQGSRPIKRKADSRPSTIQFPQQLASVAVAQKKAWKRHSYLRDRYELHLGTGLSKPVARVLADEDLRAEFGNETGYSEQELEQILS